MNGTTALAEAVRRLRGRRGVALGALFVAVGVATIVARETLLDASVEQYIAAGGDPSTLPVDTAAVGSALSLETSYGVALLLFAVVALLAEYAAVVTLRVMAGESLAGAARRRVGRTVAVGFLVGVVVRLLIGVGLVAFVLPGVFLAVSLLFAHAAVAVDDAGFGDAFGTAWELAAGRRFDVLGVVSLLLALYLVPRVAVAVVPGATGLLLGGVAIGASNLLSSGVVGRAYVAAKRNGETEAEEADPYDAPLGADDIPEPE
jgi:hypothetical protein